jgi:hypothetical protein
VTGRHRLTDPAVEAEFAEAWNAGESAAAMALRFGYSDGQGVSCAARRLGLPPRARGRRRKVVFKDDAQVEAFKADWALAMPLKEMAALHGFRSEGAVSTAARGLGLPPRRAIKELLEGSPSVLRSGQWVPRGGIMVWEDECSA